MYAGKTPYVYECERERHILHAVDNIYQQFFFPSTAKGDNRISTLSFGSKPEMTSVGRNLPADLYFPALKNICLATLLRKLLFFSGRAAYRTGADIFLHKYACRRSAVPMLYKFTA